MQTNTYLLLSLAILLVCGCSETTSENNNASGAAGTAGAAAGIGGEGGGTAGQGGDTSAGTGGTSGEGGVAGSAGASGEGGGEVAGASGEGGSSGAPQQPFCTVTLDSSCANGVIEQASFRLKGNTGCDGPQAAFCKFPPGGQASQDCRVLVQSGQVYVFATSGCPDMEDFRICTPTERADALSSSPDDRCPN